MAEQDLLLLSYQFPPAGGVAVQRVLSLAKYLPRHGYRVHVLSALNPSTPVIDRSLLLQVPQEVKLHRAFTPDLPYALRQRLWKIWKAVRGRQPQAAVATSAAKAPGLMDHAMERLLCPDPEVVWHPFALSAASRLIRRHGIQTVIATAPPFSVLGTAARLKQRFPGLRLVSDFRDSWLDFYVKTFDYLNNPRMRQRCAELEAGIVRASDLVVTVTGSIEKELRERYAGEPPDKFACVPNGYDAETLASFRPRSHGTGKVVVTFFGTIYKASSARYYLDALDTLPPGIAERFETRFIGRITDEERRYLEGERRGTIRQYGFLPQEEGFRLLEETDYALLTMTDAASITGKIFELLATGKPILAFAPEEGEVAKLLAETKAGWCAAPDDREAGARMLLRAAEAAAAGEPRQEGSREAARRFNREELTADYVRRIRQLGT